MCSSSYWRTDLNAAGQQRNAGNEQELCHREFH
jgi:hypothetical protein